MYTTREHCHRNYVTPSFCQFESTVVAYLVIALKLKEIPVKDKSTRCMVTLICADFIYM